MRIFGSFCHNLYIPPQGFKGELLPYLEMAEILPEAMRVVNDKIQEFDVNDFHLWLALNFHQSELFGVFHII